MGYSASCVHITLTSTVCLFGDDCVIYKKIAIPEASTKLQNYLSKVTEWCNPWQMSLNINKYKRTRFSHSLTHALLSVFHPLWAQGQWRLPRSNFRFQPLLVNAYGNISRPANRSLGDLGATLGVFLRILNVSFASQLSDPKYNTEPASLWSYKYTLRDTELSCSFHPMWLLSYENIFDEKHVTNS